jgi:hypothetical protein
VSAHHLTLYGSTERAERRCGSGRIPTFDPKQDAFYYVRVLEILTPSWIAHGEKVFGKRDAPVEALPKPRERAYTSPIWYTPRG